MSTRKDIYDKEQNNTRLIYLYKEGNFYKAFEHSAYMLCKYAPTLKVIKEKLKVLGGEEMVRVGFPVGSLDKYAHQLESMRQEGHEGLILQPIEPLSLDTFAAWKQKIPLYTGSPKSARLILNNRLTTDDSLIKKIRNFDLAYKTPLECMVFVGELKNYIDNNEETDDCGKI